MHAHARNGANEKPGGLFYFSNHNPDLVKAKDSFLNGGTFFFSFFLFSDFFFFLFIFKRGEVKMQSTEIKNIAMALSKAQAEYNKIVKDSVNPFFHSKYATLGACIDATRDALAKNGIAIVQGTKVIDGKNVLETILLHTSGEWVSGEYLITPVKLEPQPMGAAMTYARRYALCGMLNVAAEDDDGNSAQGLQPAKGKTIADEDPF
jgi:hypothetical protein